MASGVFCLVASNPQTEMCTYPLGSLNVGDGVAFQGLAHASHVVAPQYRAARESSRIVDSLMDSLLVYRQGRRTPH